MPQGAVATYVHNAVADNLGKLGVLVAIETSGDAHKANAFARQVAMHVAATNPLSLDIDALDPAAVEREKAIFSDQARQSGKPENIIEKMVEGRLRKFYEEVVLLKQAFVLNPDVTVEKALKDAEKEIGAPAKITGYLRYRSRRGHRQGSHRLRRRSRRHGEKVTRHQPLLGRMQTLKSKGRRVTSRRPSCIANPRVAGVSAIARRATFDGSPTVTRIP